MSAGIYKDVGLLAGAIYLSQKIVGNVDEEIDYRLNHSTHELILLSPRGFGRTDKKLQSNSRVKYIKFRIKSTAWPVIIEVAQLPFGQL